MFRPLFTIVLFFSPLMASGQEAARVSASGFDITTLLNTRQPLEVRQLELAKLKAESENGDHLASCLLGRLAMRRTEVKLLGLTYARPILGSHDFPGSHESKIHFKLVDGDYGDPKRLLTSCAMGGDLEAMLALAELELRGKNYLGSLVWSGVHAKLTSRLGGDAVPGATSYRRSIIVRARENLSIEDVSNEDLFEYVDGFIAKHGQAIITGVRHNGIAVLTRFYDDGDQGMVEHFRSRRTNAKVIGKAHFPFQSLYWVEVSPKGTVSNAYLIEAYPNSHRGIVGWPATVKYRFAKAEKMVANRHILVALYEADGDIFATTYGPVAVSAVASALEK